MGSLISVERNAYTLGKIPNMFSNSMSLNAAQTTYFLVPTKFSSLDRRPRQKKGSSRDPMGLSNNTKRLLFTITIVVLGGTSLWLAKDRIAVKPYSSIPKSLKLAAEDLVASGIGESLLDEHWFTKTDLHALSFYVVIDGELRAILRSESSDKFFTLTSPKFMTEEGYRTRSEESGVCRIVSSLRVSNTLVLASDGNLYYFDPFYGCTSNHMEYIEELDAAKARVQYSYAVD